MNSEGILREVRRRISDVDGVLDELTLDYSDDYIFEYISSAIDYLEVTLITTTTYTLSGTAISPEPSKIDGLLIAALSAKMIVLGDTLTRLKSGELGVRFRSGQDEISTIEAGRLLEASGQRIEKDYRNLVMAKLAGSSVGAERVQ